jgi:release factor glutamine methyltransferase
LTTVRAAIAHLARNLDGEEALREGEILVAHALGASPAWLFAHGDDEIPDATMTVIEALALRRSEGIPIAYLIGRRGFWSLELDVGPDVLIPRAETELLVEIALRHIPVDASFSVADLGTGSGAIALALARERPHARVRACDISASALAIAENNARKLGLSNIAFTRSDWFHGLGNERFDVVVSNPPYIASGDPHLAQGDLRFEPALALMSGSDGLDAIRHIVREAPAHLRDGGMLAVEHGFEQGAAVRALMRQSGFVETYTERDLGRRDRVSGGFLPIESATRYKV